MYLTVTRPDIAHAVGQAARFCSNPGKKHWVAVKLIMRYVKGTTNNGIHYSKQDRNQTQAKLTGFADANWAGCPDRHATDCHWICVQACRGGNYLAKPCAEDLRPELY
jgi:hypothetical protein